MENKNLYLNRLVDKKIVRYLEVFGAINIEGPKWCGKTWTSLNVANEAIYLDKEETKNMALLDIDTVLKGKSPLLIDEWNLVPKIWDGVRRKCDETENKGNFILTCSTKLSDNIIKEKINHSGAGRIATLKMGTMSLYESLDSSGEISLTDLKNGVFKSARVEKDSLDKLADFIVRGGWPSNLKVSAYNMGLIPSSYINSIMDYEVNYEEKKDKNKMHMLLKSLARNESSIASIKTLVNDIFESNEEDELLKSRNTVSEYLSLLNRLHIIENQDAYSINYRSPNRVGKNVKRHFTDPSLACALLNINQEKLLNDLKTFGLMFESLVERDLRIYMDSLDGKIFHFRDNVTGLEVDSILEFEDGDFAAIEIKLGLNYVNEAKENLLRFYEMCEKKPKFMCIITGCTEYAIKDNDSGIYIFPLTMLKP